MNPIVGQAVIVVTESPGGFFSIRSFGSPAGPSREAEEFCDRLAQLGHAIATTPERESPKAGPSSQAAVTLNAHIAEQDIRIAGLEAERDHYRAGVARLQHIEAAARAVLAHGQARYEGEEVYAGDLVPAALLQALRAAVNGDRERAQ